MIEPRRPDPIVSWHDKFRSRLEALRQRFRDRSASGAFDQPDLLGGPSVGPSLAATLLLAVGSAALALGGFWAWQSWSQRSSEPIDDLIPLLVTSPDDDAPGVEAETVPATAPSLAPGVPGASEVEVPTVEASDGPVEIIVHVSGAVAEPGVVVLEPGDRVVDAVDAAGRATRDADLERVNLAALVSDGEHVHVPAVGEEVPIELQPPTGPSTGSGQTPTTAPLVDINAASVTELEVLPGIGPATAEAIVQTRIDRGPFLAVEELLDVPGIGEAKLALLAPHVVVGG